MSVSFDIVAIDYGFAIRCMSSLGNTSMLQQVCSNARNGQRNEEPNGNH
jgi:hypothetical protein